MKGEGFRGKRKEESGKRKEEGGKWKEESGKRKEERGKWKVDRLILAIFTPREQKNASPRPISDGPVHWFTNLLWFYIAPPPVKVVEF